MNTNKAIIITLLPQANLSEAQQMVKEELLK